MESRLIIRGRGRGRMTEFKVRRGEGRRERQGRRKRKERRKRIRRPKR